VRLEKIQCNINLTIKLEVKNSLFNWKMKQKKEESSISSKRKRIADAN